MIELAVVSLSSNNLINAFIWIVIAALVFFVLNWAVGYIGIPEPFNKVAKVLIVLVAVVMLFNGLFMLGGHGFISF
ncbi:MAG: hypothetical protein ABIP06_11045 [Pyrinomonadaceae bacterium]